MENQQPIEQKPSPEEKYMRIYRSRGQMIFNNFIGGIAWSLGTLVGAGLIIAAIGLVVSRIDLNIIPVVGNFMIQIVEFVQKEITPTQI